MFAKGRERRQNRRADRKERREERRENRGKNAAIGLAVAGGAVAIGAGVHAYNKNKAKKTWKT